MIATSKSASYKHMTIPSQPLLAMYVPLQSKGCTYLSWLTSVSPHRKRSLTQKCLRSGRHIAEVKEYYKHFHHSLVWVEQSLKSNQTRINKSPSLIPRNRENCCPKMPCHFLGGFIPFKAEQRKGIATKIFDNFKTSKHLFCTYYSTMATWQPYKITFNISFMLLKI